MEFCQKASPIVLMSCRWLGRTFSEKLCILITMERFDCQGVTFQKSLTLDCKGEYFAACLQLPPMRLLVLVLWQLVSILSGNNVSFLAISLALLSIKRLISSSNTNAITNLKMNYTSIDQWEVPLVVMHLGLSRGCDVERLLHKKNGLSSGRQLIPCIMKHSNVTFSE